MSVPPESGWRAVLRWALGLLLLWAAVSKLSNLQEFYLSLLTYRLPLPTRVLQVIAIVLPWVELCCGLMMWARVWTRAAMSWALVLFLAFAVCTGQAWARNLEINCACFNLRMLGIAEEAGSPQGLVRLLESAGFAFWRALLLAGMTVCYLRGWRTTQIHV